MKYYLLLLLTFGFYVTTLCAQEKAISIKGSVLNAADDKILESVHIINLNSIKGTITNTKGEFTIDAKVNDTLYFSYLGFQPLKARVTNDWIKYGNVKVKLTEVGLALQEVVVSAHNLTGFVEVDFKNIPIYNNANRYQIPGISSGYEGGSKRSATARIVNSILNPVNSLYNIFSRKGKQLRNLRKVKKDDEIRNLLQNKFDRETLTTLLQVDKVDIDEILLQCKYSKQFIKTANDLQILDAISECYEEYKVLNRNK
ncbi:carboxypeptidase-like regulatory domain-containing protein [Aquimarina agarilytica]|uniref:carboxypeptidase-like regulatory domain-containing protein n=1 Tax=Aquimarina agarilytica TaxID=1087449 RepID=UPI000287E611|nr:carboxypeptidase-like regulatory domain-containing protein [Aquimarina agarilytica]